MNVRFPLSAKILLWLFCNLLLLGVTLYGFFLFQFHVGLDSLFAGQAASRLDALASMVEVELREAPPAQWNAVLHRFGNAYEGVDLYLFGPEGTQIAGASVKIPSVLRKRLLGFRGRPELGGEHPWHPRPPWEGAERHEPPQMMPLQMPPPLHQMPQMPPHQMPPLPQQMAQMPPQMPPQMLPRHPHAKFMVRTTHPVRYWMGVGLPDPRRKFEPAEPMVLFAVSNTLSGGGLFFDAGPWVAVGFGALALTVLFWLPLIRGITRSLVQVTRATEQVAEGNFEIRVDATRLDELGRLGQAINAMTERLAGFVGGQKRFLGDAAHELCSPLARIEVALSLLEAKADASLQPRIADVREEAQEMASLVNEILAFSKASLRGSETRCEPVALAELVARVVAREAPGGEPQVEVEIDKTLQVLAAPGLLGRAVANLIRNAVRYAGEAGPILVRAEARDPHAIALSVSDSGPGVPGEALSKLFDPFFRLDVSRSRDTGGVGLGLAIVKTCVEACGGSVIARNRTPTGLQVEITLPQA
jgi:two-component system sensor histidine kinase CpxA